jgi:hypothetical protein
VFSDYPAVVARHVQWRFLIVVASALTLAACEDEQLCTGSGCPLGSTVLLPRFDVPDDEQLTVRVCARDRCNEVGLVRERTPDMNAQVPLRLEGRSTPVSVTVRDASGKLLARADGVAPVRVVHPNGPDCPPVCRTLSVRLAGNRLVPT